jgi:hypothetical protein
VSVPLIATMRDNTARSMAVGANKKRSQRLCERKLTNAARVKMITKAHVPQRANPGEIRRIGKPARRSTSSAQRPDDTRLPSALAGGAANGIARRLRRHGYQLVSDPEGFILDDAYGPVRPAELERAKQWGAQLLQASVSGSA